MCVESTDSQGSDGGSPRTPVRVALGKPLNSLHLFAFLEIRTPNL